ncbi:MAG TPA: hypothetical protein VFR24_27755 [Candidatus Angelobacter sp.]|nr:hypothetical protein [Candidatus Angelobacter sp.]
MSDARNCERCKFGCLFDFGYSNYTVEGTEFFCAMKRHPNGHFDRFYGERLDYAEICQSFKFGEAICMDVDHENETELTPEQFMIFVVQLNEE